MYIKRDIDSLIRDTKTWIQILLGPRQCGKSTLFAALSQSCSRHTKFTELTFDDLQLRQLANNDPALFLQQFQPPLLLDEVQYAPNIFPELKKLIDQIKRSRLLEGASNELSVLFRLTGSDQILMDKNIKESLAGRAAYYHLNTLTVHELQAALPDVTIQEVLFKGGWPELYASPTLSVTGYLNNYIRSYIEKDVAQSAGVLKIMEFMTVLKLCAGRTAALTDYSGLQKDSGVSGVTVKEWIGFLERSDLIYLLRPYFNNLNKRLIKRPKLYFLDTGLAVRLQGWSESTPLLNSPQIGTLFETLVLAEIVKYIRNYAKDWELFFWRTKEGQEVDFIIQTARSDVHAFEAKYAIQGIANNISYPSSFQREFAPKYPLTIVTSGGHKMKLSESSQIVPISLLHDYLKEIE